MQTATIRVYDDAACRNLKTEAPILRVEAMKQILAGFRAALEIETTSHKPGDAVWDSCRWLRWAGYDSYEVAAVLGEQHLTRVQLYPAVGSHRFEYVFPGGLSTVECDDLCLHVIGEDEDTDQKQELLVTSTLASALHANGVSLENHVVDFTCGRATRVEEITLFEIDGDYFTGFAPIDIVPASLPATLSAAVRARGWQKTVEWLRDTQTMLEQHLDEIRMELAVWVPASAPRLPGEQIFLQYRFGQGYQRLALGAEAAAYTGHRMELVVSEAERADWLTDREAAKKAGMCPRRWRRWIETHRDVRVGRPIARNGRLAKNRRLIHRGDLRRALQLSHTRDDRSATKEDEPLCIGLKCKFRCLTACGCRHRHRDCPAS